MARLLSLPNDAGPESIISGDEYLQPRTRHAPVPTSVQSDNIHAPQVCLSTAAANQFHWRAGRGDSGRCFTNMRVVVHPPVSERV